MARPLARGKSRIRLTVAVGRSPRPCYRSARLGRLSSETAGLLKHIGFAIDGQDDRALVAAGLVHRPRPAPGELAGTGGHFEVLEGSIQHPGTLNIRILLNR